MIIELILLLELIGFVFLGLGLFPHQKTMDSDGNETETPFLNKIVYIGVSAIIFFMISGAIVSYDYTYCYVNETTADFDLNTSISSATCTQYNIESTDLSYFNLFMGIISLLLGIIVAMFAAFSKRVVGSY